MFKKLIVVVVFLCAAMAAHAEEGVRLGARLGYSMQSVAYKMGMLGLKAGVAADIPIGPIFISPEIDFLYRNNWNTTYTDGTKAIDGTQHEYAISIPLMIKFLFGSTSFIALGAQVDIPIAAKECFDDDCVNMNGKYPSSKEPLSKERADYDVGIVLSSGFIITQNFVLDIRYVYGTTPHYKYREDDISGIKSNPMTSYGFGITYFFL